MNKVLSFLSILLIGSVAFAQAEVKISKDEFLKRLERKDITMSKDPIFPSMPQNQMNGFSEQQKLKFPSFQTAFLFVPNLKTNRYVYTIFYQWPTRTCLFRVEGYDGSKKEYRKDEIDPVGSTIDKKYCELAYGIKIQ